MSDELRVLHNFWTAVILVVLSDHRKDVEKARAEDAVINAKALRRGYVAGPSRLEEREMARALRYVRSLDFRILCERAGTEAKVEAAMRWIAGDGCAARGRSRRYLGVEE